MKTDTAISYYDILEISPRASEEDIKAAYRRLALRYHPDRNAQTRRLAALRFRMITEAYETLKSQESRAHYDLSRRIGGMNASNNNRVTGFFAKVMSALRTETAQE